MEGLLSTGPTPSSYMIYFTFVLKCFVQQEGSVPFKSKFLKKCLCCILDFQSLKLFYYDYFLLNLWNAKKGYQIYHRLEHWHQILSISKQYHPAFFLPVNTDCTKENKVPKVLHHKFRGSTCLTGQQGRSREGACLGLGMISCHTRKTMKERG